MQTTNSAIDWQECLRLCSDKADIARDMLTMFIDELPNMRDAIQQAFDANDNARVQSEIHKLHGACCFVGVPALRKLTNDLETLLKTQSEPSYTLDELNREIERVLNCEITE